MAVSGAVLTGGASRRMGTDKRMVEVDGAPLLVRAVRAVRAVASEVLVVGGLGGVPAGALPDVRAVDDLRPGEGPLAGLEAALFAAHHPRVLVVAVDHPWLSADVLRLLVERVGGEGAAGGHLAVMLGTDRGAQPLVAVYRREALATISALLDAGERRATALIDALPTHVVGSGEWRALDPAGDTARDVDTPADLPGAPRGG